MVNIIDLTHPILSGMPVYPGTEPPVLKPECTIEGIGFAEKKITMFSHTGTHMDAPAHLIAGGKTLDKFPVSHFYGTAVKLQLEGIKGSVIEIDNLKPYIDLLKNCDFILLNTGWSRRWGRDSYFQNYPVLSQEAAEWLGKFNIKGIGLDTISIDNIDTADYKNHNIFLKQDRVIVENLVNLDLIPANRFSFSCFPMSFKDADGSPVRAVAIVD